MRVFGEDPDQYIEARAVAVPCAVHEGKRALPNPEWTARINWEIFMFSDAGARRAFDKDPLRYCGLLTDPVSQRRFRPLRESPLATHKGRPYYFESKTTHATFVAHPDSFALRKGM